MNGIMLYIAISAVVMGVMSVLPPDDRTPPTYEELMYEKEKRMRDWG